MPFQYKLRIVDPELARKEKNIQSEINGYMRTVENCKEKITALAKEMEAIQKDAMLREKMIADFVPEEGQEMVKPA